MRNVDRIRVPGPAISYRVRLRILSALAYGAVLGLCSVVLGCYHDVDSHAVRVALLDGAVAQVDGLDCYAIEQEPDLQGTDHGTAMASVLLNSVDSACEDANRIRLGSFPVLDEVGGGATADSVADALLLALDWDADLVNVSIDLRTGSRKLEAAVATAEANGVPVIAAAGNRFGLTAGYPSAYDSVVAVGACDSLGKPLWMSAGPGVDICALGTGVPALDARGKEVRGEGTSFAAAVYTRTLADGIS